MKKKIIDEKGRLFGFISMVDVLVIIVAAVLACAVYARFFTAEKTAVASGNDAFTYQLKISGVRDCTVNALGIGDKMYDTGNKTCLGTIKNIQVTPNYREVSTLDGNMALFEVENRYDILLTVEADGLAAEGRFYAARTFEISANAGVSFFSHYCTTSGVVWGIPEKAA